MNRTFYAVLVNTLTASLTNTIVWFAVTFWVYLETRSVLATSVMAGVYLATVALSGFFLGSLVDRHHKKKAMMISSVCSLLLYLLAFLVYVSSPSERFKDPSYFMLWAFIIFNLLGAIAGNIRTIALSTLVTILIPEDARDRANGMVGTANGVSFLVASIFSGLIIGFLGVFWMLVFAIVLTTFAIIHLLTISIPEMKIAHTHAEDDVKHIDIRGTIRVIRLIPGLFALIFFNTFNNFLGGVFMALMDAYGLSLVSVQVWGILWGVLTLGFIVGGIVISKKGLGQKPLRTLFLSNIIMWTICIFFTMKNSIVLLACGMFIYLCLIPVVEAAEQTIIQKLIPQERLGRVFGFAQSIEQAASPLTAFMIGPIAQFIFIPFMTTGAGVDLLGSWFGTGTDRGIALLFTITGIIGLIITVLAMQSYAYRNLAMNYQKGQ
ncbi:MFS transporter [Chitinophaga sp. S165]|uniref:MFS transporter n=1 Tax=Chitinophaga sp. S165 TaxID=2135462 RepID=UPI000D7144DC|nr:MFS transporter [Chitinophaga sp. S165]PWV56377.1 DHA3 family multidrug efflux protein-like MFS transporter [Chitinophaga sp. S165]